MRKTNLEKIAEEQKQIEQAKNRVKQLKQAHNADERKKRTNRLCKRHGHIEKVLPDIITLTDEQFEAFISETLLTDFTQRKLNSLMILNNIPDEPSEANTGDEATVAD